MALKVFKKIEGFDELENFYGETINGIYMNCENFQRSFCKCGKVTSTLNDACECGNDKFRRMRDLDYYSLRDRCLETKRISEYDSTTDTFNILADVLTCSTDRETVTYSVERTKIISLRNKSYTIHDKSLLSQITYDDFKDYKYLKDLEAYLPLFYDDRDSKLNISLVITIIDLLNNSNKFITDADCMRFKHLTKRYMNEIGYNKVPNVSFVNAMKGENVYPVYFEILNKFLNDNGRYYYRRDYEIFRSSIGKSYYSAKKTYSEYLDEMNTKYSKAPGHIWPSLYHHLLSGAISLTEFTVLLKDYNYLYNYDESVVRSSSYVEIFNYNDKLRDVKTFCDWYKPDYIKMFPIYLKENLYGKPTNTLVQSFLDDLYSMTQASIPITEDSIKLKNFNYNINERTLSENLGIPSGKIEIFLDTFDRNPLASVSLLKDRRALTKKQLADYMELIDKES